MATSYFILSLLCITTLNLPTARAAKCNAADEAGLLAFKAGITSDPSGKLQSWKSGTDCCTWSGITCEDGTQRRVRSIQLYGNLTKPGDSLSGTISPSLSKLQNLDSIYLMDLQNLTGPFPSSFPQMAKLAYIYIENSRLTGRIPDSIGNMTQMVALSLQGNRLYGPIPSSLGKLTQAVQLKLGENFLTGTVPLSIQGMKQLSLLRLDHNQLTGTIPDFFNSLKSLISVDLRNNKLTGNIPASVTALAPSLRFLELGHNLLSGKIPDFLGRFRALDTLDLSWNSFSGVVPKTFSNLTKIFNLDLSHNQLVDPFPTLFVKGIESLDLSYNQFHLVNIPSWVTSSPIIYSLKLAKCGLKLKLDSWKPSETYFYDYIDLSENEITGSPFKLLNSTEFLVGFYAAGNKLQFDLETLRLPKSLKFLDLSRNLMKGKVPSSVSGLQKLNVSQNHLCGLLPKTSFPASAFAGNDCLCGSPLAPCKSNCLQPQIRREHPKV